MSIHKRKILRKKKGCEELPIYDNIKTACKEKGITISVLEEELEFTRGSIYKWSKHCPSVEKIKKVADYFGVSIEYFLEKKEQQEVV